MAGDFLGAWNFGKALQKVQLKINPVGAITNPVSTPAQAAAQRAVRPRFGFFGRINRPATVQMIQTKKTLSRLPPTVVQSLGNKIMQGVKKWHRI
jgi:hypothetical protein